MMSPGYAIVRAMSDFHVIRSLSVSSYKELPLDTLQAAVSGTLYTPDTVTWEEIGCNWLILDDEPFLIGSISPSDSKGLYGITIYSAMDAFYHRFPAMRVGSTESGDRIYIHFDHFLNYYRSLPDEEAHFGYIDADAGLDSYSWLQVMIQRFGPEEFVADPPRPDFSWSMRDQLTRLQGGRIEIDYGHGGTFQQSCNVRLIVNGERMTMQGFIPPVSGRVYAGTYQEIALGDDAYLTSEPVRNTVEINKCTIMVKANGAKDNVYSVPAYTFDFYRTTDGQIVPYDRRERNAAGTAWVAVHAIPENRVSGGSWAYQSIDYSTSAFTRYTSPAITVPGQASVDAAESLLGQASETVSLNFMAKKRLYVGPLVIVNPDTGEQLATFITKVTASSDSEFYACTCSPVLNTLSDKVGALFQTTSLGGSVIKAPSGGTTTIIGLSGSGSGGTMDYTELRNKPSIEGVELVGNHTAEALGFATRTYVDDSIAEAVIGGGGMSMQLLWTNTDTTAIFPAQTVQLDLSECGMVAIRYKALNTSDIDRCVLCLKGTQSSLDGFGNLQSSSNVGFVYNRYAEVRDTGVIFGGGHRKTMNASAVTSGDQYIIPYQIYGIRF